MYSREDKPKKNLVVAVDKKLVHKDKYFNSEMVRWLLRQIFIRIIFIY